MESPDRYKSRPVQSYTYDNDGNLLTKKAPSPNQPSASTAAVTTTYTYDALNRLTGKTYSDTYGQNTYWSAICADNVFSYDAMGRTVGTWPSTPTNCGIGSYPLQYSYDLMGHRTSIVEAPGWTISYQYDAAGRPSLVTSSQNDSQHPGTLFTADPANGYFPSGALRNAKLGNNLTRTAAYNSRLQPCRMNVNSSNTSFTSCTDAVPSGNVQDFSFGYSAGTSDNGNPMSFAASGVSLKPITEVRDMTRSPRIIDRRPISSSVIRPQDIPVTDRSRSSSGAILPVI